MDQGNAPGERPEKKSKWPGLDWGVLVGGVGVIVAVVSLWLSSSVRSELRDVSISGEGVVVAPQPSFDAYSLDLSLINSGLRPVVIRKMSLRVGGQVVATVGAYVPVSEISLHQTKTIGEEEQSLPFALSERSGMRLAALLSFRPVLETDSNTPAVRAARRLCRSLHHLRPPVGLKAPPITLEVESDPGGTKQIPVTVGTTGGASVSILTLLGSRFSPSGINLFRRLADPDQTALPTLELFSGRDPGPVQTVRRPLFGRGPADFPFRALGSGRYQAVVLEKGQVVERGYFVVPVPRGPRHRQINLPTGAKSLDVCSALESPPFAMK